LFEIVEEKIGAREMTQRSKNNGTNENNNGKTIEQQYGTMHPGTFRAPLHRPLPIPTSREGVLITLSCLQIVADSAVGRERSVPSPAYVSA
jgi:hypothetical protein